MTRTLAKALVLVFLTACGCRPCCLMTFCDYASIETGTPIADVEACYGCPYDVCESEDGVKFVTYIERIHLNAGFPEQHDYIFKVEDGIITQKCYEYHEPRFQFEFHPEPQHHIETSHAP